MSTPQPAAVPRRPRPRLPLAAGVVCLVVALGGLGWIAARDGHGLGALPAPSAPSAKATASVVPTAARPGVASPGSALQAVESQVASVENQMPSIRQLAPLRAVPTDVIAPSDLPGALQRMVDASATPVELSGEQNLLIRLGLAGPGLDLRALTVASMSSQALGFYSPETGSMTIVNRGGSFGIIADFTVAHEFTHALQDQHYHLLALGLGRNTPTDRVLALQALVEGDASLAGALWLSEQMARGLSIAELLDLSGAVLQSVQPVMPSGAPPILVRETLFPYLDGLAFVQVLYASGGWAAVDAAYARPPESASEILHPGRYLAGWRPVVVNAPRLDTLGGDWHLSYLDTLGELGVRAVLETALGSTGSAGLAAGWAGDQVASWDGPPGMWAVVWRSSWSSEADAGAFAAAWARLVQAPTAVQARTAGTVATIVLASDRATLARASVIALGG